MPPDNLTPEELADYLTIVPPRMPRRHDLRWRLRTLKRHERGRLPWERLSFAIELLKHDVCARRPLHGNAAEMLRTGQLRIGRRTFLGANVLIRCEGDARMLIGEDVTINLGAVVSAERFVVVGDHVLIGPGCYITDGNHEYSDPVIPVSAQGMTCKGPTIIEDNVWLGAHVVVTSGVRIGRRSIVGANSVVTHDIPPYSVAAGSPARVFRTISYEEDCRRTPPDPITSAALTPSEPVANQPTAAAHLRMR